MTPTKSIAEINRELGEWVLEDAKRNPQAYAGRFVGIANGKVVIATNDLNEFARKLREVDPNTANLYGVDIAYDYSKPFMIGGVQQCPAPNGH